MTAQNINSSSCSCVHCCAFFPLVDDVRHSHARLLLPANKTSRFVFNALALISILVYDARYALLASIP
jgi:hypothetical protein